ncbi:flagellar biosynthesis protein FlaG [Pseudomonas cavernicola]|uniref:Flagellar biosynthesis protein FlaG n=1 Tax=Pseudomonas cavernicola TaxID=2320866 RepID=A0A418XBL8_9PSED|nr:flagellar protein FlaG [Pseudomonas cavernicola]RJG09864.1 flagellar biosynthesis protein FlaG [Pseudomonas cavernicola]
MDVAKLNGLSANPVVRLFASDFSQAADTRKQAALEAPLTAQVDQSAVQQAVSTIAAYAQSISRNLSFNLDDSSGRVVVKVTDSVSGEVIRQIPSEEALKLAESLAEARSLLFKAEA